MKTYLSKTKASSRHSRARRAIWTKIIWIGVALATLFIARSIIGSVVSYVTVPVHAFREYMAHSSAAFPSYIRDRSALLDRIEELEDEVVARNGMREMVTYLEAENDELREGAGIAAGETIAAGVIARPPYTPYDTIILDRGYDDGIVAGAPVYYGAGLALGYVRTVEAHHAFVTLFSSPNVETTAYIFGPDIFTTAYGEGGGIIRLSVPQGIRIQEGDLVALPSLEKGVIGAVRSVVSVSTEPEQRAYVQLETPLQSLRMVRVGKASHMPPSFEEALRGLSDTRDTLFTVPVPPDQIATTTESMSEEESVEIGTE